MKKNKIGKKCRGGGRIVHKRTLRVRITPETALQLLADALRYGYVELEVDPDGR